jgi:hypothetical protein
MTLYYLAPADETYDKDGIISKVGFNPETSGVVALNYAGVYPVTETVQPFNTNLYDATPTYAINGTGADQSWSAAAKTLSTVIEYAQNSQLRMFAALVRQRRQSTAYNDMSVLTRGSVPASYNYWTTRIANAADQLDLNLADIEGAANVDAVNNIISAAWGAITLQLDPGSPTDLLATDFTTLYSKDYAASDLELYFPGTDTTVAYSSGFAATASAVSADDYSVQIRVAATSVVVDELVLSTTETAFDFGFKKYEDIPDSLAVLLDAAAVVRANSVDPVVTGELSGVNASFSGTEFSFPNLPGPYGNDGDAAAGGVALGQLYYENSGRVHIRIS